MHVKSKVTLGACVRRAVGEDGGRLYAEVGNIDGQARSRGKNWRGHDHGAIIVLTVVYRLYKKITGSATTFALAGSVGKCSECGEDHARASHCSVVSLRLRFQ